MNSIVPEIPEERAIAIGSSNQPRLSLARGEGNFEGNLRRLALTSSFKDESEGGWEVR